MRKVTLLSFLPDVVSIASMHRFSPLREIHVATLNLKGYDLNMNLRTAVVIQSFTTVYARSGDRCARFHPVRIFAEIYGNYIL
jgi:hypothetical protein